MWESYILRPSVPVLGRTAVKPSTHAVMFGVLQYVRDGASCLLSSRQATGEIQGDASSEFPVIARPDAALPVLVPMRVHRLAEVGVLLVGGLV